MQKVNARDKVAKMMKELELYMNCENRIAAMKKKEKENERMNINESNFPERIILYYKT